MPMSLEGLDLPSFFNVLYIFIYSIYSYTYFVADGSFVWKYDKRMKKMSVHRGNPHPKSIRLSVGEEKSGTISGFASLKIEHAMQFRNTHTIAI